MLAAIKKVAPTSSVITPVKITGVRIPERAEYRISTETGELKSVVFRTQDKKRKIIKYIGKRHPDFGFYAKGYRLSKNKKVVKNVN